MLSMASEMHKSFSSALHSRKGPSGRSVTTETQCHHYSQDTGVLFTFGESSGINYWSDIDLDLLQMYGHEKSLGLSNVEGLGKA